MPATKEQNIMLTIEYVGTNYCGWQVQPNGTAVQEVLTKAIKKITRKTPKLTASGRTDAGVHARGQVANFLTDARLTPAEFQRAINANTPKDIAVIAAQRVPKEFHAQYNAKSKTYIYTVYNAPVRSAFAHEIAWHIPQKLSVAKMKSAAKHLAGEHDFRTFAAIDKSKPADRDHVRNVTKLEVTQQGHFIYFEVEADGFLYKMVRNIVGTLVEAGRGKWTAAKVKQALKARDRKLSGPAAPPHGLCLWNVKY